MMKSKTWLVTGASRGIGLAMVVQLLASGERVFAVVRSLAKAPGLKRLEEEHPERLQIFQGDVTIDEDMNRLAFALAGKTIDVLVNNAGLLRDADESLVELNLEGVLEQFKVNALSPLRVTRALLPMLRSAPSPVVANITSKMGSIADASTAAYGYRMSKTALNMFTKCLVAELPSGIALSLHPGWVKTEMGGAGAPVEVVDSARGLLRVIREAKHADSGSFLDFRGQRIPW